MTAGRFRDDYATAEFAAEVRAAWNARNWSLRDLELKSRVNRGTISHVLRGDRPCSRQDRLCLMDTLGFDTANRWKFLRGNDAETFQVFGLGEETPLQFGTRLVAFVRYGEALHVFRSAFDAARTSGDLRLQVLGAERLAWFYSELEQYAEAHYWIDKSIATVEACLNAPVAEIASSIRVSQAREADLDLVNVLSRVLHFQGKMLTVRALHDLDSELPQLEMRRKAAEAFARSRMLDERLPTPAHLGHDLRWNAVLLSVDPDVRLQEVQRLLSASQERFSRGSFAHVLLLREQGVFVGRWAKSAQHRLSSRTPPKG